MLLLTKGRAVEVWKPNTMSVISTETFPSECPAPCCTTVAKIRDCLVQLKALQKQTSEQPTNILLFLLPLALQPIVGFGLSNNTSTFFPIYHHLSPSSHSQHLKISFYFFSSSFPRPSPSFRPFQFLSEDLFGHPILLHSLQVTQPTSPLPHLSILLYFLIYSSLLVLDSSYFSIPHLHI
jgi:hypothetical protein